MEHHNENQLAKPNPALAQRKRPKRPNRITITQNVTHQIAGESPVRHINKPGFTRIVHGDDQPYVRKLKATSEAVKLDQGWVGTVGLLRLDNDAQKNPSGPNDRDTWQTLEVAVAGVPAIAIPPGEWVTFEPYDLSNLTIRCIGPQGVTVPYTISVYPR